jgi:hypothetical protein
MSDFTNPPDPSLPPLVPNNNKNFTSKQLAIAMFIFASFALLIGVIIAPSDKASITKDTVASSPSYTIPSSPPVNKYDDYVNYVLNNSGQANTWSKADVIRFGDLVCQALDNNNPIRSVVTLLEGYSKSVSDAELFASVMIGSINNLCPEYKSDLSYYLNS